MVKQHFIIVASEMHTNNHTSGLKFHKDNDKKYGLSSNMKISFLMEKCKFRIGSSSFKRIFELVQHIVIYYFGIRNKMNKR